MRAALLALLLAVGATIAGYAALAGIGALAGGWSGATLRDQAIGLALHAGVSLARGVVPTVLATAAGLALWLRVRGVQPGGRVTLGLAMLAAAGVTATVLTLPLGDVPRLEIHGAANVAATVAVLGGLAAASLLGARRLLGSRPVA